jgi:hypothetical protein
MKFKAVKGIEANMSRGLLRIFSVPTIAKKIYRENFGINFRPIKDTLTRVFLKGRASFFDGHVANEKKV